MQSDPPTGGEPLEIGLFAAWLELAAGSEAQRPAATSGSPAPNAVRPDSGNPAWSAAAGGGVLPLRGEILPQRRALLSVAAPIQQGDPALAAAAELEIPAFGIQKAGDPPTLSAKTAASPASGELAAAGLPAAAALPSLTIKRLPSGLPVRVDLVDGIQLEAVDLAAEPSPVVTGGTASPARGALPEAASPMLAHVYAADGRVGAALGDGLGRLALHMIQYGARDARLQIHPAHLGAIDVQLKVDGGVAEIAVCCTNPQVRDALEQAVPRLRELFGDTGLQLTHVDVEARERHAEARQFSSQSDDGSPDGGVEELPQSTVPRIAVSTRLIDTFA